MREDAVKVCFRHIPDGTRQREESEPCTTGVQRVNLLHDNKRTEATLNIYCHVLSDSARGFDWKSVFILDSYNS
jgi:hypothetical protein